MDPGDARATSHKDYRMNLTVGLPYPDDLLTGSGYFADAKLTVGLPQADGFRDYFRIEAVSGSQAVTPASQGFDVMV
jgi:hypothetical protein